QPGQVVYRYDARTRGDLEGRRSPRRDVGRQVPSVDDPSYPHVVLLTRDQRDDPAVDVLAAGQEGDLARTEHPFLQDAAVVGADLRSGGALVQARLGAALLDAALTKQGRRDAVERGRLVEPHERIGVQPVAPGA